MASSFEHSLLAEVVTAARAVGLELILVGNAAAALQAAPVTTRDIDFLVRDTPANQRKIVVLAERLGGLAVTRPALPLSTMIRLVGMPVEIDFVFGLSGGIRFEVVRSRAVDIRLGTTTVRAACLADIIAAKKAAARPKDLAALPVLEQTARVLAAMQEEESGEPPRQPGTRPQRGKGA